MGCGSARSTQATDISQISNVIFVLGGPGCGKGTYCKLLVENDGFVHLSAGDLLREEQETKSTDSELIKSYIKEGKIVPVEITCRLLLKAMQKKGMDKKFLIDGFPRNLDNMEGWNKVMSGHANVKQVLFFDTSEEVMLKRIMKRAETSGRADDNVETAKKRFRTFNEETMKVINIYDGIDEVYKDVKKKIAV